MIGIYNTEYVLRSELEKVFDIAGLDHLEPEHGFPDIAGLYIDWKTKESDQIEFAHQAVVVENYVKKGIPTVIFDRHMAISFKEYSWLKKFNVTFFEPAVCNRSGFGFMPFWTLPDTKFVSSLEDKPRKIDLAYQYDLTDKILSFEKYYVEYVKLYPQKTNSVLRQPRSIQNKIDEWSDINFTDEIVFNDVNFVILIGTKKEYKIGYLPEHLFYWMDCGVIPLLPPEHRFYGTIFRDFLIRDIKTQHYFISCYSKFRSVMIEDIKNNFLTSFPECDVKNVVEKLRSLFTI